MENILSDGEISKDSGEDDRYSTISSDEEEYVKTLTTSLQSELKSRQIELELENELHRYDDYAKENRLHNSRSSASSRKKQAPTKPKKGEIRNRSYRASSVLSNYSLPKRKRNRPQSKRKHSRHRNVEVASRDYIDLVDDKRASSESDDVDCELIELRINALKSKQEFKEPDSPRRPRQKLPSESNPLVPEEEQLRIDALKSALLKKKPHFMEKKRKRMLEFERPYSPTDDLDRILDDPMELSSSPIHSPFNNQDDVNQMDMEISNSSPECPPLSNDQGALSDMEIASSPTDRASDPLDSEHEDLEEEKALRSMLLTSISTRRKAEEKSMAKNLKQAVERIRQKHTPATILPSTKSGNKTIKMILEEKKNRKEAVGRPKEYEEQIETENLLLNQITIEQNAAIEKLPIVLVENDSAVLISTISDTKNIPLLPSEAASAKKSRILTSLASRPVKPLIISVNAESTDDENGRRVVSDAKIVKKTHRKIIRFSNTKALPKNSTSIENDDIEKKVESILKKIREQSEKDASKISIKTAPSESKNSQAKSPIKPETKAVFASSASAVNHLPKSGQIEYAMLIEKMKKLEEAEAMRKARQVKRQKSLPKGEKDAKQATAKSPPAKPTQVIKSDKVQLSQQKVEDTLSKIQQLDENARNRFAASAENKYLQHSKNLKESTDEVISLIDANALEVRRRKKVDEKILELEKQLAKFNSMKKVVEQRIVVGIPQVVRAQNKLISMRNHQFNFGNMCSKVGEIVRGAGYSLPEGLTQEIQANISSIVEKCDKIQSECSDHFAIKHLKVNSQRIREFIVPSAEDEKVTESPLVPESKEEQRVLADGGSAGDAAKKIKYQSPLEFLSVSNGDSEDNINKVVCPFALEGSCTDKSCKMLHF